jgi:glycosyltransferase involved in cell wall biosynthesis
VSIFLELFDFALCQQLAASTIGLLNNWPTVQSSYWASVLSCAKSKSDLFCYLAESHLLTISMIPPLTVLQVVPELGTGGAERTTIEVAEAIVKSGGRALVWSGGGRLLPELAEVGGEHFIGEAASKNPFKVFITNPTRLQEIVTREKVDLIHARSRAPAWSALIAAQRCKVPFVTTYHGIYNAKSALKRWYNGVMVRGDAVIANSNYTKAHLIEQHGTNADKVQVIYRGVDVAAFDPSAVKSERTAALAKRWGLSIPSIHPRIILPARLTEWKGQAILLAALGILKRAGCSFEAILVGDSQGRETYVAGLQAQIAEEDLSGLVRIVGHCNDMPAAFSLCDIAVTPSTEAEAFGRTAAEAQAMGLPIIASDLGGARETVAHGVTGFLVAPSDYVALAATLKGVLEMSATQRGTMGTAGFARIRELFTTQSLQRDTLALYQRLLKNNK